MTLQAACLVSAGLVNVRPASLILLPLPVFQTCRDGLDMLLDTLLFLNDFDSLGCIPLYFPMEDGWP
jgi:hypothetical protein